MGILEFGGQPASVDGYPFLGYIHQIVGYSAYHNEGRRQQIRYNLKSKWGISHF